MDWLPALLKHLRIARSAIAAAFVTALVLLIGPRVASVYLPQTPVSWVPVLVAVCVFTGCLLAIWFVEAVWLKTKRTISTVKASRGLKADLDEMETTLVYVMGRNPADPFNLDHVNYAAVSTTRLEVMEVMERLSNKGLVNVNPFAENLVTLTDVGRKRALELHRMLPDSDRS
ncbi:hypothetical protein OKW34_000231 [Paraburkholderia youngii]|uniref:hypothetical protein n=1 Tax=Paraburkholderia youngii TaxID=2782701 RepID=UPI003D2327AE